MEITNHNPDETRHARALSRRVARKQRSEILEMLIFFSAGLSLALFLQLQPEQGEEAEESLSAAVQRQNANTRNQLGSLFSNKPTDAVLVRRGLK